MKKRVMVSMFLLERDYRPCRGGKTLSNFLTCPLFDTHEREDFSGSYNSPGKVTACI